MRLLIVLRGIPASGKSTFIQEHDLQEFVLCPDDYRIRFGGITVDEYGRQRISEKYNKKVWAQLYEDLESRMIEGITTVIDATHTRETYFNDYNKLCEKYRYRMVIVEFNETLETCKERNSKRAEYKQYDNSVLEKMYNQMQNPLPAKYKKLIVSPENFEAEVQKILLNKVELNDYSSVVVVGDIHGCYTALIEGLQKSGFIKSINEDGSFEFDNSIFVVFVGDYIDRGIENDKVVEFLYSIKDFKNVKLLEGNHETHLLKLSREGAWNKPHSCIGYAQETCKTVLSLTEEQRKKLSLIAQKCGYIFTFDFKGKKYIVTHSAIPSVDLMFLSAQQIIRGIDPQKIYENCQLIDEKVTEKSNRIYKYLDDRFIRTYFIHGHSNPDPEHIPIHNTEYTFNLCDDVEKGGNLRILKLD